MCEGYLALVSCVSNRDSQTRAAVHTPFSWPEPNDWLNGRNFPFISTNQVLPSNSPLVAYFTCWWVSVERGPVKGIGDHATLLRFLERVNIYRRWLGLGCSQSCGLKTTLLKHVICLKVILLTPKHALYIVWSNIIENTVNYLDIGVHITQSHVVSTVHLGKNG